ncbi:Hypothetical predicted protein, partial [Lynx pardinus]
TRKLDTWRISRAGEALGADSNNGFQQRSERRHLPTSPPKAAASAYGQAISSSMAVVHFWPQSSYAAAW